MPTPDTTPLSRAEVLIKFVSRMTVEFDDDTEIGFTLYDIRIDKDVAQFWLSDDDGVYGYSVIATNADGGVIDWAASTDIVIDSRIPDSAEVQAREIEVRAAFTRLMVQAINGNNTIELITTDTPSAS